MVQRDEIEQKEEAVQEVFPLNNFNFPLRMVILRTMKASQLLKLGFSSPTAARDIRSAQLRPEVLTITIGDWMDKKVEFKYDDISCIITTKSALEGKTVNEKFFPAVTFSGEIFKECTTDNNSIFIIVPEEKDFQDAVKNIFDFLCKLFQEAMTTNLVVRGEFAYLYPVINSIRNIKSLNRLEFYGHWGSEEHQKKMFDDILETSKFYHLGVHGTPPVGSKLLKITTDSIYFNLDDPSWLSEERFREFDARKIIFQNAMYAYTFAKRFNFALKSWNEGTGLQRLESIICYDFDVPSLMRVVQKRLPMRQWEKERRPGYYCIYKTGEDGEKEVSKFQDLRQAEDLTNPRGELGTVIGDFREEKVMFMVWTQKELDSVREAHGIIEKCRQKHLETEKKRIEQTLEQLEDPRKFKVNEKHKKLVMDMMTRAKRRAEEGVCPPGKAVMMSKMNRRDHISFRTHEPQVQGEPSEQKWESRDNKRAIQECDFFLNIIKHSAN